MSHHTAPLQLTLWSLTLPLAVLPPEGPSSVVSSHGALYRIPRDCACACGAVTGGEALAAGLLELGGDLQQVWHACAAPCVFHSPGAASAVNALRLLPVSGDAGAERIFWWRWGEPARAGKSHAGAAEAMWAIELRSCYECYRRCGDRHRRVCWWGSVDWLPAAADGERHWGAATANQKSMTTFSDICLQASVLQMVVVSSTVSDCTIDRQLNLPCWDVVNLESNGGVEGVRGDYLDCCNCGISQLY